MCIRDSDMEVPIRKLDQSDAEAVVFLGKVGLSISAEHLQQSKVNRYDSIFLIPVSYTHLAHLGISELSH